MSVTLTQLFQQMLDYFVPNKPNSAYMVVVSEGKALVLQTYNNPPFTKGTRLPLEDSAISIALKTRNYLINKVEHDNYSENPQLKERDVKYAIYIPLAINDEPIACFVALYNSQPSLHTQILDLLLALLSAKFENFYIKKVVTQTHKLTTTPTPNILSENEVSPTHISISLAMEVLENIGIKSIVIDEDLKIIAITRNIDNYHQFLGNKLTDYFKIPKLPKEYSTSTALAYLNYNPYEVLLAPIKGVGYIAIFKDPENIQRIKHEYLYTLSQSIKEYLQNVLNVLSELRTTPPESWHEYIPIHQVDSAYDDLKEVLRLLEEHKARPEVSLATAVATAISSAQAMSIGRSHLHPQALQAMAPVPSPTQQPQGPVELPSLMPSQPEEKVTINTI